MTDGPGEPDVRFLLANERTFLAWVRTAIGLIAAGVAIFHLFDDSTATTTLALVLLAAGAFAGLAGYTHHYAADRAIRQGHPMRTTGAAVVVVTLAVLVAGVAGAVSVLAGA